MHDGVGWWMLIGIIVLGLFWAFLVADVAWLIARWPHDADSDAFELARRRYARGEIGREEFQRISDDLTHRTYGQSFSSVRRRVYSTRRTDAPRNILGRQEETREDLANARHP